MLSYLRARPSAAAIALAALLATPVAAQQEQPTEFQSWRLNGWSFTPGVVIGALFDSNVAVAFPRSPGEGTVSDKLYNLQPFGQLEYFSPRTTFSSGYKGTMRRYFELSDLDGFDNHSYVSLRHLVTRRVTVFATDSFVRVPTTDLLQLNGVPFRRTGARYNSFAGGVEARLSRTLDFNTRYDLTWVDFERKDTLLTGGFVNGVRSSLSHRFTERSSLGGEYGVRFANLNQGTKDQTFQELGAVYRYRTGPLTSVEAAFGYSHLDDHNLDISRDGPYVRVGITRHAERSTLSLDYERSFVPSVSFGGSNQSQELRGYVQMPITRNRLYLQEAAAWRRTNPFAATVLPLDSLWLNTVAGYAVQRWFRLEGYYSFSRQDTRITAGQISRHIVGAQVVVSEPMRIR